MQLLASRSSELAKSFGGLTTKPQPAQDISGAASRKQAVPIAISCPDHDCPPSLDEQNLDEAALLCSTIGGSTISPSIFNLETLGTKLIDKLGSSMKTTVLSRIALRIVFLLMEVATLGCFTRSMPTEKYEQAGSTIDVLRRRIFTAAEQQVSSGVKESDIFPQLEFDSCGCGLGSIDHWSTHCYLFKLPLAGDKSWLWSTEQSGRKELVGIVLQALQGQPVPIKQRTRAGF